MNNPKILILLFYNTFSPLSEDYGDDFDILEYVWKFYLENIKIIAFALVIDGLMAKWSNCHAKMAKYQSDHQTIRPLQIHSKR